MYKACDTSAPTIILNNKKNNNLKTCSNPREIISSCVLHVNNIIYITYTWLSFTFFKP